GEPLLAEAGDADAELHAVARHRAHDRGGLQALDRARRRLRRAHRPRQEELVVVAGDEPHDRLQLAGVGYRRHQRRGEPASQQAGGRGVAHVHLVAHGEGLRHQRGEIDRALALEHRRECRRHRVPDPGQALERLAPVTAEAKLMPPGSVRDERRGPGVTHRILDDQQGGPGRDDAGHWPDGAPGMTGRKGDVAAGRQRLGLLGAPRPALELHGGLHRPAHRPAHPIPRDRWPRVQQRTTLQVERLARRPDGGPRGSRPAEAVEGFAIGGGDVGHGRRSLYRRPTYNLAARCPPSPSRCAESPRRFAAWWPMTASISTSRRVRSTRWSARTAPARAPWPRSSTASTGPTPGRSAVTAPRSRSARPRTPAPSASAWCSRTWSRSPPSRWPRTSRSSCPTCPRSWAARRWPRASPRPRSATVWPSIPPRPCGGSPW